MSGPFFDPDAVIDAMAPLLGFDIRPENRAAVAANLRIAAAMAAVLLENPLGDHAEPAAVFVPSAGADWGRDPERGDVSPPREP